MPVLRQHGNAYYQRGDGNRGVDHLRRIAARLFSNLLDPIGLHEEKETIML
jgi:hypothetical protein